MPYAIADRDWPDFRRLLTGFRSGEFHGSRTRGRGPQAAGRPLIRAILLEKLESGSTATAAVTLPERDNTVQEIALTGTASEGQ